MNKDGVLKWAESEFGVKPEYLWLKYPGYAVLRNPRTEKWFGIVMNVPKSRLGLPGEGEADVLDVKCSPLLTGSLLRREGFVPAYHMNKNAWIGILLDGTAAEDEIRELLRASYAMTAPKKRRKAD